MLYPIYVLLCLFLYRVISLPSNLILINFHFSSRCFFFYFLTGNPYSVLSFCNIPTSSPRMCFHAINMLKTFAIFCNLVLIIIFKVLINCMRDYSLILNRLF